METKRLNYKILNNHIFDDLEVLEFLDKFKDMNNQIYYKWGSKELTSYLNLVMFNDELPSTVFSMKDLAVLFKIQSAHEVQFPQLASKDIFDFTF